MGRKEQLLLEEIHVDISNIWGLHLAKTESQESKHRNILTRRKNFLLNYVINHWTYLFRMQRILPLLPIPEGYWNCWHSWLVTIKSPIYMLKHSLTLTNTVSVFQKIMVSVGNPGFCSRWPTKYSVPPTQSKLAKSYRKDSSLSCFSLSHRSLVTTKIISILNKGLEPELSLDSFSLSIKTHRFSQRPYRMLHSEILLEYFGE